VESLFTASLHISDFVQTQNKAKILTVLKYPCQGLLNLLWIVMRDQVQLDEGSLLEP
jgi:hypothetical protein